MSTIRLQQGLLGLVMTMGGLCGVGCDRMSNHLSQVVLDCGPDADKGRSYVKVLDPRGQETDGRQLVLRYVSEDAVAATSRGCFPREALNKGAVIISTQFTDRVWGAIARQDQIPFFAQLKLEEQSSKDLLLSCASPLYTNGQFPLPIELPEEQREAFPFDIMIANTAGQNVLGLQDGRLAAVPATLADGEFLLDIRYRNLFRPVTQLTPKHLSCDYILDRTKPMVRVGLDKTYKPGLYQVEPGEKISMAVIDTNPNQLHTCLAPLGSDSCADAETFQKGNIEASVQAPESGQWCLSYWADDLAHNRSPLQKSCFIAYRSAVINQIKTLLQSAKLQLSSDPLHASLSALKANDLLHELATDEERAEVSGLVNDALVSVQGQASELNRFISDDVITSVAPWGKNILLRRANRLELLDLRGQTMATLVLTDRYVLDKARQLILVYGAEKFVLYSLDTQFHKLSEWNNSSHDRGSFAAFHPTRSEIAFADSKNVLHFFKAQNDGKYAETSSIETWEETNAVHWSSDDKRLMTRTEFGFQIWSLTAAGTWEMDLGQEGEVVSAAFIRDVAAVKDRMLFVKSDGTLWLWSAGKEAEALPDKVYELPENHGTGAVDYLQNLSSNEVLFAAGNFVEFLRVSKGKLETATLKNGQPLVNLKLGDLKIEDRAFSLRTENQIFAFSKVNATWVLSSDLKVLDASIDSYAALKDRTVTVDQGGRRLRFWSKHSLLNGFTVDSLDSPWLGWLDGETLVSSGFDGDSKIWDAKGKLLKDLVHSPSAVQVNELFWNKAKSLFVSVGEDGHVLVRDAAEKILDNLDQRKIAAEASSMWIGTGLFARDQSTFLTAAAGSIIIWKPDATGHYQAAHIIKDKNLGRSRSLPGDIKTFTWKDQEIVLIRAPVDGTDGFAFYDFEGNERSDIFPSSGRMQAIDLDGAGEHLAYVAPNGSLELHSLSDKGFTLQHKVALGDLPWQRLQYLRWSPDSRYLVGIFARDRMVIWERKDKQLVQKASRFLNINANGYYYPMWMGNTFLYRDMNTLYRLNPAFDVVSTWSPYASDVPISAVAFNEKRQILAVGAAGQVKIIDLSRSNLEKQLCDSLKDYLSLSNEFERVDGLNESDRLLCSFLARASN